MVLFLEMWLGHDSWDTGCGKAWKGGVREGILLIFGNSLSQRVKLNW